MAKQLSVLARWIKQKSELTTKMTNAFYGNTRLQAGALGVLGAIGVSGRWMTDPASSMARDPGNQNITSPKAFREAGFWRRQATVATLGMAMPGTTSAGALTDYWGNRITDVASSYATKPVGLGMAIGAGIGMTSSILMGAFSKAPIGKAIGWATAGGAVAGAYTARKVQMQVINAANTARRAVYQKQVPGNRARGGGPGYMMWSNQRTKGKPGHLGMTGDLPFAMHKARHRSTV